MNIGLSRTLLYSHMRVFVISKDIASSGMMEFLDAFERSRESSGRLRHYTGKRRRSGRHITGGVYHSEIFFFKIDGTVGKCDQDWGSTPAVKINDFIQALTSPGRQPVMSAVRIQGDPKKGESVDNMKKTHPDATCRH